MRRVVSLFLPTWQTDRLRREKGAPALDEPLVIAGHDGRRRIVVAADQAAQALGLRPGLPLAEAQARVPGLHVTPHEPAVDAAALQRLAAWAWRRYSPVIALDPPDGLLIDITGAAHLHGGEVKLLRDLLMRLRAASIAARVGLADTVGAAHALARFAPEPLTIAPPGETVAVLAPLPLTALRLDADCADRLFRLGFATIADLIAVPRAPLALRFGPEPGRRLDQALGRLAEPLAPFRPPEFLHARQTFAEPIGAPETLAGVIAMLTGRLCLMLERRGLGARRLDLLFARIDGRIEAIRVGTARPARDPERLARLLTDRLETVDPGFGIERMTLVASLAEPLMYRQGDPLGEDDRPDMSALIDRLANRLGARRLYRVAPVESDIPERSVRRVAPLAPPTDAIWPEHWPRPSRLLSPPERIETVALLPDHAPARFTWRGVCRRIMRADGPERVFSEWWRSEGDAAAVRDYFIVEDASGERFWLFRSGDGEDPATGDMRWYIHGVFA